MQDLETRHRLACAYRRRLKSITIVRAARRSPARRRDCLRRWWRSSPRRRRHSDRSRSPSRRRVRCPTAPTGPRRFAIRAFNRFWRDPSASPSLLSVPAAAIAASTLRSCFASSFCASSMVWPRRRAGARRHVAALLLARREREQQQQRDAQLHRVTSRARAASALERRPDQAVHLPLDQLHGAELAIESPPSAGSFQSSTDHSKRP